MNQNGIKNMWKIGVLSEEWCISNGVISVNTISEGKGPVVIKITFEDGHIIKEKINASFLDENRLYKIVDKLVQQKHRNLKLLKIKEIINNVTTISN
jgi:hypothetical protein